MSGGSGAGMALRAAVGTGQRDASGMGDAASAAGCAGTADLVLVLSPKAAATATAERKEPHPFVAVGGTNRNGRRPAVEPLFGIGVAETHAARAALPDANAIATGLQNDVRRQENASTAAAAAAFGPAATAAAHDEQVGQCAMVELPFGVLAEDVQRLAGRGSRRRRGRLVLPAGEEKRRRRQGKRGGNGDSLAEGAEHGREAKRSCVTGRPSGQGMAAAFPETHGSARRSGRPRSSRNVRTARTGPRRPLPPERR